MSSYTFNDLVSQLRENVMKVTFTKVNGEVREMPCTLVSEYLPSTDANKTNVEDFSVNESVIRAYAIDKQAWRSFRVENVTAIEVVDV